jgi:hypothetical protein
MKEGDGGPTRFFILPPSSFGRALSVGIGVQRGTNYRPTGICVP